MSSPNPTLMWLCMGWVYLDPAFVDQGVDAVVQAAGADTQALGDLALGHVGIVLQHAQHPKVGVFLKLGAAAGH